MKNGQIAVVYDNGNYSKSKHHGQVVRVIGPSEQKGERQIVYYRCALASGEVLEVPSFQLLSIVKIYDKLLEVNKQLKNLEIEENSLRFILSSFKSLEDEE